MNNKIKYTDMTITMEDINLVALDLAEITYEVCGIRDAITDLFLAYITDFTFSDKELEKKVEKEIIEKYNLDEIQCSLFEEEFINSFQHIAFSLCYLKMEDNEFIKILNKLRKNVSN